MKIKGWDLDYFNTGEWQVVDERLKDLEKVHRKIGLEGYCPGRQSLFAALRAIPYGEVRACIIGQDPYPERKLATGIAFSVPREVHPGNWPPTLRNILKEYSTDLRVDIPSHGSLDGWSKAGVLLWNAIPSCGSGHSLSHDWHEWSLLTKEIVTKLSQRGIVFAFLGGVARRFTSDVTITNNEIIVTSHPSPLGQLTKKNAFMGSRLFSTINDKLVGNGLEPIDWKLE